VRQHRSLPAGRGWLRCKTEQRSAREKQERNTKRRHRRLPGRGAGSQEHPRRAASRSHPDAEPQPAVPVAAPLLILQFQICLQKLMQRPSLKIKQNKREVVREKKRQERLESVCSLSRASPPPSDIQTEEPASRLLASPAVFLPAGELFLGSSFSDPSVHPPVDSGEVWRPPTPVTAGWRGESHRSPLQPRPVGCTTELYGIQRAAQGREAQALAGNPQSFFHLLSQYGH